MSRDVSRKRSHKVKQFILRPPALFYQNTHSRAAGNRTRPTCTPCTRTADILQPAILYIKKHHLTLPYFWGNFKGGQMILGRLL